MPSLPPYRRAAFAALLQRLQEPRRFIQVISGPHQVVETTLVRQVMAELENRLAWAGHVDARVVLLGSAPLLIAHGLVGSLAARFELIRQRHWAYGEMRDAFDWDSARVVLSRGYPRAAGLVDDLDRWRSYLLHSLAETTLSRDILLLTRVDKPALLRQLLRLGCYYSAQVVSFTELLGQLRDAGNTTTFAHFLHLLGDAGLLTGPEKFSGSTIRRRGSSPELLALETGLVTAMSGADPAVIRGRGESRGRLVEAAAGAHPVNAAPSGLGVTWWRVCNREVDSVLLDGRRILAIEAGSSEGKGSLPGLHAFTKMVSAARAMLVGAQGLPLDQVLNAASDDVMAG